MLVPRQGHHRYAQEAIVASRATPVVDSVEVYWQQIKNTEPLSRAQEVDLFTRAKAGDEDARQQIIECNLRFVVSVARQYRDYGLSLSELISEGNVGLMEGAKRFDETRGFKFITYAVWWIRQAILKALAEQGRITIPPMSQINDLQKLEKQAGILSQRLGRSPTSSELSEQVDISPSRTRNALEVGQPDLSFDAPAYPGEETTLHGIYVGRQDEHDEDEMKRAIRSCLLVLDEREGQIVRCYFGLGDNSPMTLEEIGDVLGVTRERVRQLRNRALSKLADNCGEFLGEFSHK